MKEIAKVSRKLSDLLLIIFRSQLNYPTSIAQDSPSPDMQGRAQLIKMKEDAHQVYKFANAFVFVRNSFKKKQWDLNYLSNDEKHFYAMWQPDFNSSAPFPTLLFYAAKSRCCPFGWTASKSTGGGGCASCSSPSRGATGNSHQNSQVEHDNTKFMPRVTCFTG